MSGFGSAVLDIWIDVECPRCQAPFEVQIVHVACQVTRPCPVCRCQIQLVDSGAGSHRTVEAVNTLMDDLTQSIEDLFK